MGTRAALPSRLVMAGVDLTKETAMVGKLSAEFIGTFWLVLGGCGRAVLSVAASTRTMVGAVAGLLMFLAPSAAHPQVINPADYLPLGDGFQWQYQRAAGSGPSSLHLEVTDVNATDTGTRYFLEVPSNGVNLGLRLEYTPEGTLRLRAIEADLNTLLDGLPLDPTATADIQFMPPVLLGTAPLVVGNALTETPVDTE